MYITRVKSKGKDGKTFTSILLRESQRVGKKVKTKTIAVLTHLPEHVIASIQMALEDKEASTLERIEHNKNKQLSLRNGFSFGAIWTVFQVAKQLGIPQAIGKGFFAQLLLWQVIARLLHPGCSLLAMTRMAAQTLASSVLGWKRGFSENDLYESSPWIEQNQNRIEKELFKNNVGEESLYLYDVTSSYFEGEHNELADYGYNRDKKEGKKQVVMGLLTDSQGQPCSVRLFPGNTSDTQTFAQNIATIKEDFGCENVTMVGDRGMIKGGQIQTCREQGLHYITAISKPQIDKLIKEKTLQMELFDEEINEVVDEKNNKRYIIKRNPVRAEEIALTRQSKLSRIEQYLKQEVLYQQEHPRARWQTRLKNVSNKIEQLKISSWLSVQHKDETLVLHIDEDQLAEESRLDGCYVITTDLTPQQASKEEVHDRYKDLSAVEKDFRTMKTGHLEMRPWFVRTEESTRAHAFSAMLALKIYRHLESAWKDIDITVKEGLDILGQWNVMELIDEKTDTLLCRRVPKPNTTQKQLLDALGLVAPENISINQVDVVTHKDLKKQRKSA